MFIFIGMYLALFPMESKTGPKMLKANDAQEDNEAAREKAKLGL